MASKNLIAGIPDLSAYAGPGNYTKKATVTLADINAVATTGDSIKLWSLPPKSFVNRAYLKHSVVPAAPSLTTCTCTLTDGTNTLGASLNLATAVGPTIATETSDVGFASPDVSSNLPISLVFNWAVATAGTFTAGSIDVEIDYTIEP